MKEGSVEEKHLCYCGEQFNDNQRESIRKNVCRGNSVEFKDKHGNSYCVFHYPSFDKKDVFALAFFEKIDKEDYFFEGTWFPFEIDFSNHTFNNYAEFIWTEFNCDANFEKQNSTLIAIFDVADSREKCHLKEQNFQLMKNSKFQ